MTLGVLHWRSRQGDTVFASSSKRVRLSTRGKLSDVLFAGFRRISLAVGSVLIHRYSNLVTFYLNTTSRVLCSNDHLWGEVNASSLRVRGERISDLLFLVGAVVVTCTSGSGGQGDH